MKLTYFSLFSPEHQPSEFIHFFNLLLCCQKSFGVIKKNINQFHTSKLRLPAYNSLHPKESKGTLKDPVPLAQSHE